MEDPAPSAPLPYNSHPRQRGNYNNGLKAQVQILQEKLETHEEVLRRLGDAFSMLGVQPRESQRPQRVYSSRGAPAGRGRPRGAMVLD